VNFIQTKVNDLYNNGHISKQLKGYLLSNLGESKLGSFRLLAKLNNKK